MTDIEIRLECLRITGSFSDAERAYSWVTAHQEATPTALTLVEPNDTDLVREICDAYLAGKPVAQIASECEVPKGSLYAYLRRGGVQPRRYTLRAA